METANFRLDAEMRFQSFLDSQFTLPYELPAAKQSPQKPLLVQFIELFQHPMPSSGEQPLQMMRRDRAAFAAGEAGVVEGRQHAPPPGPFRRQSVRQRPSPQRPCRSIRFNHIGRYTDGTDDIMSVGFALFLRIFYADFRRRPTFGNWPRFRKSIRAAHASFGRMIFPTASLNDVARQSIAVE